MSDFETINIVEIKPSTYNPRQISNTEYNKLSNSINEFGGDLQRHQVEHSNISHVPDWR